MRVTIIGAGAIGSLLGHSIARSGHELTVVDQPGRVAQLRDAGGIAMRALDGTHSVVAPSRITDEVGGEPQDVVILATKAHQLDTVAPRLSPLLGDDTAIVTVQNGIPWWYCQGLDHELRDSRLQSLDPEGRLLAHVPTECIVGCVAYPAAELLADGTVVHVEGQRLPIGELDGVERARTAAIATMLEEAGFKSRILDDIRSEIWLKAWGALSINPVSALSRATMEDICTFPATRALIADMMQEARHVAETLGVTFRHSIEKRIDGARAVGAHKTSMLQDLEAGRAMEVDALLASVLELAALTGQETPSIRAVHACVALLNESLKG